MDNKQQTAIELAFDYFDNLPPFINHEKAKESINNKKIELLKVEKTQIINARQDGHDSTSSCDSCGYKNSLDGSNETYYKEIYEK